MHFLGLNFNGRAALSILAMLLASVSLQCQAQKLPQRSITQLSPNLYRAQNDIHFTVFLVTPEGIILTDPLNRDFSTWLKQQLDERFGLPVKYILYSHHHWDHASGGAVFADTARFMGQENMLAHLALPPPGTPLLAEALALDANGNGRIEAAEATGNFTTNFAYFDADGDGTLSGAEVVRGPVSDVKVPDITYRDRATVSLGGHHVELTWTGPVTHADDMSIIRFPDEGVVYVVDFISIKAMPYRTLGTGYLDEWLQAIRTVEAMDFEIVSPGHGVVGTKSDIAEHRHYLEDLRDAVKAGIEAGRSSEELQHTIQLTKYKDWFMFDAWHAENVAGMYQLLQAQK
ncbi:MAG TPA: MBL fold metallo-hydrolase [Xanthomonadales bacterium]|nr:MBL fold metallo-hydrolase [Xanthomonadales bacterium]